MCQICRSKFKWEHSDKEFSHWTKITDPHLNLMYDVSCTNSSCLLIETSVTACLLIIMMNNKESPHRIDLNGHLAPLAKQTLLQFSICPSRGAEVNVRKKTVVSVWRVPPFPYCFLCNFITRSTAYSSCNSATCLVEIAI